MTGKGKRNTPCDVRLELIIKASQRIADTDEAAENIAKNLGTTVQSLDYWAETSEELADIYYDANVTRACRYYTLAKECLENIEEFWTDEKGSIKERQQSVNIKKFKFEKWMYLAGQLSPEKFGDRAKDIREIQRDIDELKKRLDDKK